MDRQYPLPTSGPPWIRSKYPIVRREEKGKMQAACSEHSEAALSNAPQTRTVHHLLPRISLYQVTLLRAIETLSDRLLLKNTELNFTCFVFFNYF